MIQIPTILGTIGKNGVPCGRHGLEDGYLPGLDSQDQVILSATGSVRGSFFFDRTCPYLDASPTVYPAGATV